MNSSSDILQRNLYPERTALCIVAFLLSLTLTGEEAYATELLLTVEPAARPARVAEPHRIEFAVSWFGSSADYAILPAELTDIEWGNAAVIGTRARVDSGRQVVTQTLEIVPTEAGAHRLPEIRVPYLGPGIEGSTKAPASEDKAADGSPALYLTAESVAVTVKANRTRIWCFAGILVSVALLAAVSAFLFRRGLGTIRNAE